MKGVVRDRNGAGMERLLAHLRPTDVPRAEAEIRGRGQRVASSERRSGDRAHTTPAAAGSGATRHVFVFAAPGRFGGWPANHGLWSWGNEILVGFSAGTMKNLGPERHNIDRDLPEEHLLARSLDGGETWVTEHPAVEQGMLVPVGGALHGVTPPGQAERQWTDCPGGIPFTHPDFCMTLRLTDTKRGPSRFYYSVDRGHVWLGPYRLPLFDQVGVAARTDYVVNGPSDCTLFLTASKPDGSEGRPFAARTTDGGKTWGFVSWINEHPSGYAIMPSTVELDKHELLTAVRRRDTERAWIECYRSTTQGNSWELEAEEPAPELGTGNAPSMIRLVDGRVCLTYGYRARPFGMRARLSEDNGRTWLPEIVLRDDGGGTDVGYPRSCQRASDGKVVTVYYFHTEPTGDRSIVATIWQP